MCARRDTDQRDRGPQRPDTRRREDGNNQSGADQHGCKPRVAGREPETAEGRGQPASTDTPNHRNVVNDDEGQPEMRQVQIEFRAKVRRQPEQIEPPDRIGKEFGGRVCPSLAITKQSAPRYRRAQVRSRLLIYVPQFSSSKPWVVRRLAVIAEPPQNPEHAEDASSQK